MVEVSEGSSAWSTTIRRVPTSASLMRPAARARVALSRDGSVTRVTLAPTPRPTATTVARSGADSDPTMPTR